MKDIAFTVVDCHSLYKVWCSSNGGGKHEGACISAFQFLGLFYPSCQSVTVHGGVSVQEPWDESDEFGTVTFASVRTVSYTVYV